MSFDAFYRRLTATFAVSPLEHPELGPPALSVTFAPKDDAPCMVVTACYVVGEGDAARLLVHRLAAKNAPSYDQAAADLLRSLSGALVPFKYEPALSETEAPAFVLALDDDDPG